MLEQKDLEQVGEVFAQALEKTMPTILEKTGEAIEKKFEEKGYNKIEKKIFGFAKEVEGLEGKEKIARFVKAVFNRDKETARAISGKAMTEGTDSQGGYLVPEEFRAEVIRLAESFGIVRNQCRVIPMKRDTLNLPKITTSVSVYWPGETNAGTVSAPVLGQVQLLAKTLVGLTPISNELLEDADVDTVSMLAELFAEAIAGEEDAQGLIGDGSPFEGVLNDSDINIVTMESGKTDFTDITVDYLRDVISKVKPLALSGAGFYMHRGVWNIVQKLTENGQHISTFSNPIITGDASKGVGIVGYIWGYPVYLPEKMDSVSGAGKKFILFGNLQFAYLGDRKQMTMAVSEEATIGTTNLFESNMSAVRITERIGFKVALGQAFACLKTAAA